MSKYVQKMDWATMIKEIFEKEPDPDINWTHASLGKAISTSRSTIGRMLMDKEQPQYLEDPKFSQGMALIRIHREIREKLEEIKQKAEEA